MENVFAMDLVVRNDGGKGAAESKFQTPPPDTPPPEKISCHVKGSVCATPKQLSGNTFLTPQHLRTYLRTNYAALAVSKSYRQDVDYSMQGHGYRASTSLYKRGMIDVSNEGRT